jgi:trimeric autotransporter adhesin
VGVAGGTLLGGWRGLIVKDWTVVTNITVGSGLPLTPSCSGCIISTTGITGPVRPEYVGGDIYSTVPGRFLNRNAYIAPLSAEWGDAGRNSITGPGQFSMNGSMARTFRVGDRNNLDVRFDSTNILNHVVFGSWNTAFIPSGIGQFGIAQSPNNMRMIKATIRFRF